MTELLVAESEILPGYRLIEPIGAGGFGAVWKVQAPGGLYKAAKVIFGRFDDRRASDELRAVNRIKELRHPFLLSLERIEVVDQQLIVISELADGSLDDRFQACRQHGLVGIPREELLRYLREAAEVLDFMQAQHGLQHLDVKPGNLLVVGGHVKVADFGLVKSVHGPTVSMTGGLTPAYAAPEVFDGGPSERSDQYSLAIVYQHLLTGVLPFQGESLAQFAGLHLRHAPDLSPLPEPDRKVVARALSKNWRWRFATCTEFVQALSELKLVPPPRPNSNTPRPPDVTVVIDVSPPDTDRPSTKTAPKDSPPSAVIEELTPPAGSWAQEIRPTLVVGVGGCGVQAVSALRDQAAGRWRERDPGPALQLLVLDSDARELESITGQRLVPGWVNLATVDLPLRPSREYRRQREALAGWLDRRWLYNIPRTLQVEGIRPLGRLTLVDHADAVRAALRKAIDVLKDGAALEAFAQHVGLPCRPEMAQAVIVGSISGGTGGGTVLDVARVVNEQLRAAFPSAEVRVVLAYCASLEPRCLEVARVNACATLSELADYQQRGIGDEALRLPALDAADPLFRNVSLAYLGEHASEVKLTTATDQLAQYLWLELSTPVASLGQHARASRAQAAPETPTLQAVALARLATAAEDFDRWARRLASGVLWACAGPDDAAREGDSAELGTIAQCAIDQAKLTADRLLQQCLEHRAPAEAVASDSVRRLLAQANPNPEALLAALDRALASLDQQPNPTAPAPSTRRSKPEWLALAEQEWARVAAALAEIAREHNLALLCNGAAAFQQHLQGLAQHLTDVAGLLRTEAQTITRQAVSTPNPASTQNTGQMVRLVRVRSTNMAILEAQLVLAHLQEKLTLLREGVNAVRAELCRLAQSLAANPPGAIPEPHLVDMTGKVSRVSLAGCADEVARHLRTALHNSGVSLWESSTAKAQALEFVRTAVVQRSQHVLWKRLASAVLEAAFPPFLRNGGGRRRMLLAPAAAQAAVQAALREPRDTKVPCQPYGGQELIAVCEGQDVPLGPTALSFVGEREEFRIAASRLHSRNDVAWTAPG